MTLEDMIAAMEGKSADCGDDCDEKVKTDEEIEEEAKDVDPDDLEDDVEDSDTDVAKESAAFAVNAEQVSVALDIIALSCCESYLKNPSEESKAQVVSTMEGAVGDAIARIKEWFKKLWSKIVGWANKVKMYVLSYFMKNEKFLKKYESELNNKYNTLASRDITMELIDFSGMDMSGITKAKDGIKQMKTFVDTKLSELEAAIKDGSKVKDDKQLAKESEAAKGEIERANKMLDTIAGMKFKKYDTKLTASLAKTEIKWALNAKSKEVKELSDMVNEATNYLNQIKARVDKINVNSSDSKSSATIVKITSMIVSTVSAAVASLTKAQRMGMKLFKARISQATAIARKVLGGSATKEGAMEGEAEGAEGTMESTLLDNVMKFI